MKLSSDSESLREDAEWVAWLLALADFFLAVTSRCSSPSASLPLPRAKGRPSPGGGRKETELATAFARSYVALVESLIREGVAETTAREEARMAAYCVYQNAEGAAQPERRCSVCGTIVP